MHKPSRLKSAYNKVMGKLALNPDVSVTRLFAFKLALGVGLVGALTSTLVLIYCSNLQADLTYKGFNHFFVVFKFPVSVLAAMLSMIGLIALAHRSEQSARQIQQSAKQIKLSESQNNFTNYYKHVEEFEKYIKKLNFEIEDTNIYHMHFFLFPYAKDGDYDILELYNGKEYKILSLLKEIYLFIEKRDDGKLMENMESVEKIEEIEKMKNTLMESIPIAKSIMPEVKKGLVSEGSTPKISLPSILIEINHTTVIYRTISQFNPLSNDEVSDIIIDIDIEEKHSYKKIKFEVNKAIEKIEKTLK